MTREDSTYPADWQAAADKDMKRAHLMLDEGDVEDAGFHLQQAAEKQLKAYLLANGWALRKIHHLDTLLEEAMRHRPALAKYQDLCERVSQYYIIERYPSLGTHGIGEDDIMRDTGEVEQLIADIQL